MTDADLADLESRATDRFGPSPYSKFNAREVLKLIAEVRRLRADNAALIGSVQVYMKTAMATNEQLNAVMAERDELRACLRIAMEWCPNEGGFSTARDYERCRRAMGES